MPRSFFGSMLSSTMEKAHAASTVAVQEKGRSRLPISKWPTDLLQQEEAQIREEIRKDMDFIQNIQGYAGAKVNGGNLTFQMKQTLKHIEMGIQKKDRELKKIMREIEKRMQ